MSRLDPHSYADATQPQVVFFAWKATVDFDARRLVGNVELTLAAPSAGPLDLDTRGLDIESAAGADGRPLPFRLEAEEPILGSRLRLDLPPATRSVHIAYRTRPNASALQWLTPAQTAGKRHPYLFSQCQAIHARSVVPLQDTPRHRVRFRAELTVPRALKAVMAARFVERKEAGDTAVETFEMPQTIPPYLLAFAVGDLTSRPLGPRSSVWAEPAVVDAAAWEFAQVDDMLRTAETLFGPYPWEQFDLLVMPPSFPYGGMENPRLTFLTPALLAGDRTLVNVVAHELAHSWTGNLVSNASAEHFWLNEGFTVFAERRILEALDGADACALHAALGRRDLDEAVRRFAPHPELTRLRTHLSQVDPDEAFSQVPYEKGYLFLRALEEAAGRDAFSAFLRRYVDHFQFQSLTTEDFLAYLGEQLPGLSGQVDIDRWVNGAGVPAEAPSPRSAKLEALARATGLPASQVAQAWSTTEWQLYLEALPRPATAEMLEALDARFALSRSKNYEILVAWLQLALSAEFPAAVARVQEVLGQVGRMKYLRPLYATLAQNPRLAPIARKTFNRYREGYHPIAQQVVEGVLQEKGV